MSIVPSKTRQSSPSPSAPTINGDTLLVTVSFISSNDESNILSWLVSLLGTGAAVTAGDSDESFDVAAHAAALSAQSPLAMANVCPDICTYDCK